PGGEASTAPGGTAHSPSPNPHRSGDSGHWIADRAFTAVRYRHRPRRRPPARIRRSPARLLRSAEPAAAARWGGRRSGVPRRRPNMRRPPHGSPHRNTFSGSNVLNRRSRSAARTPEAVPARSPRPRRRRRAERPYVLQLGKEAEDLLFRAARTANTSSGGPVSEEQVRAIHDLVKFGTTAMN